MITQLKSAKEVQRKSSKRRVDAAERKEE